MKKMFWFFSAGMFFVLAGYSLGLERPLGVLFGFSMGAAATYLAASMGAEQTLSLREEGEG